MTQPSKDEIKKGIEESGYLLEQRICPVLDKSGFAVFPNEHYKDPDTGKSREIDVYAVDLIPLYRDSFDDTVSLSLLIECKNNHTPVVFFSQRNDLEGAYAPIKICGMPECVHDARNDWGVAVQDFFRFRVFHHYYSAKWVSTQFCQLTRKSDKGRWSASHEKLHESVESLVKATDFLTKRRSEHVSSQPEVHDEIALETLYPVLLFAGPIYECKIQGRNYRLTKAKHIALERDVQSSSIQGTFRIDVIHESYLGRYMKLVIAEKNEMVKRFKRKRLLLKENVLRESQEKHERSNG